MAAHGLLDRVHEWYSPKPVKPQPPVLSSTAATLLSIAYVVIYVLPFYLSSKTRPSPGLQRDAPAVIRARLQSVFAACVITCGVTTYVASQYGHMSQREVLHLYGWWPLDVPAIGRSLLLVVILFAGPLTEQGIIEGHWRSWLRGRDLANTLSTHVGFRNYVAGPVTEEFVFRSLIITLHVFAKETPAKLIFVTPLFFGIAHIHHLYEFKLTHPEVPLVPSILRSIFQFSYTSVFGFFAAFVHLRTGSLLAAILVHSFCNWMGLPRFWGRIEAPTPLGPQDIGRKEDIDLGRGASTGVKAQDGRLHLGWTVLYYLILAGGAAGFYRYLWALTETSNAIIQDWT